MALGLAVIDMQKAFLDDSRCAPSFEQALEYINPTIELFRRSGAPVIHIQDTDADGGQGTPGFEIIDDVDTGKNDIYVTKSLSNAFWETDLEKILHEHDVDYLIVCGFAAEHCVVFTYNGADERGFTVSILQHGVAGYDRRSIELLHLQRSVISYHALEYFLKTRA